MKFDLVSDLHSDMWDTEYQIDWAKVKKSNIIVVAGDVADNIDLAIVELKRIAENYSKVIYIDGNHEHHHTWPNFTYTKEYLRKNLYNIKNIDYIYNKYVVIEDVAFIGACGWWDFKFGEPEADEQTCREMLIKAKGIDICNEIVEESINDFEWIRNIVNIETNNDKIREIILITHTAPHPGLISWNVYPMDKRMTGCYGNSKMKSILDVDKNKKIKRWVFGHNHDARNIILDGINYVSNPRGRPRDFNRVVYHPITLEV